MTILSMSTSLSTFTFIYNIELVMGNFFFIPFMNPKHNIYLISFSFDRIYNSMTIASFLYIFDS